MLRRCVELSLLILLLAPARTLPAAPDFEPCAAARNYDTLSLQRARELVKSHRFSTPRDRVECGTKILEALGPYSTSPACDSSCRSQYARLHLDHIEHIRQIGKTSKSLAVQRSATEKELKARQEFGAFLVDSNDAILIERDWSDNFEGLGDAMYRLGYGKEFHREAMAASHTNSLSQKSYENWAFAIRSCNEWDFASGPNRDFEKLRKILYCVEECQVALRTIRSRVDQAKQVDKHVILDTLDSLLPALGECPREPS